MIFEDIRIRGRKLAQTSLGGEGVKKLLTLRGRQRYLGQRIKEGTFSHPGILPALEAEYSALTWAIKHIIVLESQLNGPGFVGSDEKQESQDDQA